MLVDAREVGGCGVATSYLHQRCFKGSSAGGAEMLQVRLTRRAGRSKLTWPCCIPEMCKQAAFIVLIAVAFKNA